MGACYEFQITFVNCYAASVCNSLLLLKLKELLTKQVQESTWARVSLSGLHLLIFRKPCQMSSESGSQLKLFTVRWLLIQEYVSMIWKDVILKNQMTVEDLVFCSARCRGMLSVITPLSVSKQTVENPVLGRASTLFLPIHFCCQ